MHGRLKKYHKMITKHMLDFFHKVRFHVLLQISKKEKQKAHMEPGNVIILQESKSSY